MCVVFFVLVGGLSLIFPNDIAFPLFEIEQQKELSRDVIKDGNTTKAVITYQVQTYDIRGLLISECLVREESTEGTGITVGRFEVLECSANVTRLTDLILIVILIIYGTYYEMSPRGATIGKNLAGILVVTHEEKPLTLWRSLVRNIVEFLSYLTIVGYLLALFTKRRRALHDFIAGTMVVWRPPKELHKDMPADE